MSSTFIFSGKNSQGRVIKGTMTANSQRDVALRLREQGYFIVSITEKKESKEINLDFLKAKKVNIRDLAVFCRQMSTMIEAGLPLVQTLVILRDQATNPVLKDTLADVVQKVETGRTLYEATAAHPKVFPKIFSQMIKAGEAGGLLEEVLERLSEHFEKELALTQKVKSALMYPIVIISVAIGVVFFLMVGVIPTFVEMFAGLDSELPGITLFIIDLSDFLRAYWYIVLGGLGMAAFFLHLAKKTPKGELLFDGLALKIPLIGDLLRKTMVSRFARTLGTLSASGVPIIEAVAIVEEIIENRVLANILTRARIELHEGVALSVPLEESMEFPRMLVEMVRIGEETGNIDAMLNRVADFYDQEVDHSVEGLVSMIEPAMVVFIAGIVGLIVISVMMPMFEMLNAM